MHVVLYLQFSAIETTAEKTNRYWSSTGAYQLNVVVDFMCTLRYIVETLSTLVSPEFHRRLFISGKPASIWGFALLNSTLWCLDMSVVKMSSKIIQIYQPLSDPLRDLAILLDGSKNSLSGEWSHTAICPTGLDPVMTLKESILGCFFTKGIAYFHT